VLAVLEAFKAIKEKHLVAKKIVEEAMAQAEKLKNEIEQKGIIEYEEAYRTTLNQAKQKAVALKRKAEEEAEHELNKFLAKAEDQAKRIEVKASKNFDTAVSSVLNMVLQ